MNRLFGTDGARGIAITELTCELSMQIGRAAATVLTKHNPKHKKAKILIGKDTRISSDVLEMALAAGIASVGADVEILGIVPTPAVAYLVTYYNADAGVMISASHNPVQDNGIKLFSKDGFKLPDDIENEIEALILDTPELISLKQGVDVGRIKRSEGAASIYIKHLEAVTGGAFGRNIKAIIDCANGSSSVTAESLFKNLGVDCTIINNTPDGCNINDNCGSTHIENLCKTVVDNNFDLGIAFDGDADRCLAVDEKGDIIDGDKLIAVISNYMKTHNILKNDTAVVTVMSNLGFHSYMQKKGINTVCTKVGDRYVLEEMLAHDYNIGGEQSGHIIFLDNATTGDGQLTAVMLLKLLSETGKKLSELTSEIENYPQILINVRITEDKKGLWDKTPEIMETIKNAEKIFGNDGRILVRESGTEALVRVMIEGKDGELVNKYANEIAEKIKECLN